MRGDQLYTLPDGGPALLVSYLGMQAGTELPSGHVLTVTRRPRVTFGLGPPLPPRAVHPHDFLYGTLGATAGSLSLDHMLGFLGLLPDSLESAAMLWSGQCTGAKFSHEVAAFLESQSLELRRINMEKWAAERLAEKPFKYARKGPE